MVAERRLHHCGMHVMLNSAISLCNSTSAARYIEQMCQQSNTLKFKMVRLTIRFLVLDMYMGSLKAKSLERTQRCMHFYGVESDERWHATRIAQTTGAMLQDLLAKPLENVQSHGVQISAMGSRLLFSSLSCMPQESMLPCVVSYNSYKLQRTAPRRGNAATTVATIYLGAISSTWKLPWAWSNAIPM